MSVDVEVFNFIKQKLPLLLDKVSLRQMPQIFKGNFSSLLEKIWAQIRQSVFDCVGMNVEILQEV